MLTQENEIKLECLKLAHSTLVTSSIAGVGDGADKVVKDAEKYYEFVKGEGQQIAPQLTEWPKPDTSGF